MKKELDIYGDCPLCKQSWDAGEMPKAIRRYYDKPYRFSKLIGIETLDYDGVSIWKCPFCKTKWNRFTGEITK